MTPSQAVCVVTVLAIVSLRTPALAQTPYCGNEAGASCSTDANGAAVALPDFPTLPPSLASAVAAADPAVQAELARTLAMAREAATAAAQASVRARADIATIEAGLAVTRAQAAQAQQDAAVPPCPAPVDESPP